MLSFAGNEKQRVTALYGKKARMRKLSIRGEE